MPQVNQNYGARYSVPVSQDCAKMIGVEVQYQKDVDNNMPVGRMLGEIIEEGLRARFESRGIKLKPKAITSAELIEAGQRPEVQEAVNREGSGRSA